MPILLEMVELEPNENLSYFEKKNVLEIHKILLMFKIKCHHKRLSVEKIAVRKQKFF